MQDIHPINHWFNAIKPLGVIWLSLLNPTTVQTTVVVADGDVVFVTEVLLLILDL